MKKIWTDEEIIAILKNIRRFYKEEKGADYYAGWNHCLDNIILDFKQRGLFIKDNLKTNK